MRSQQNLIVGPVEGYKIVNEDMTCRDFKFEIGKRTKLPNDDDIDLCKNGFHFFKYPSGVWIYYETGRVFKVRAYGVLETSLEAGADFKLVCEEIELYEELEIGGDHNTEVRNTGNYNTGDLNTGDYNTGWFNTGDHNTGDRNTGDHNTGNYNSGCYNTGDLNLGDGNTGYVNAGSGNTGNFNTGSGNTGNFNTGSGNCGDLHSGSLNIGKAPFYLFNKITKTAREDIDWDLVHTLTKLLQKDDDFDPAPFLSIPNATAKGIKKLHAAHKAIRK